MAEKQEEQKDRIKMEIIVNGVKEKIEERATIFSLIKNKDIDSKKVVVEHNYKIIPEDIWEKVELAHNDKLEIVSFVGGG